MYSTVVSLESAEACSVRWHHSCPVCVVEAIYTKQQPWKMWTWQYKTLCWHFVLHMQHTQLQNHWQDALTLLHAIPYAWHAAAADHLVKSLRSHNTYTRRVPRTRPVLQLDAMAKSRMTQNTALKWHTYLHNAIFVDAFCDDLASLCTHRITILSQNDWLPKASIKQGNAL